VRKKVTNTKKFPLFKHYSVTTEGKSVYLFSPFFTINMSSQLENNRKICSENRQCMFSALLNNFKKLIAFSNMSENLRNHTWMVFLTILSDSLKLFRQLNYFLKSVATSFVFIFIFFIIRLHLSHL